MMSDKYLQGDIANDYFKFEFSLNYTKYVHLMQNTMKNIEYKVKPYGNYYKALQNVTDDKDARYFTIFSLVVNDNTLKEEPIITNEVSLGESKIVTIRTLDLYNQKNLELISNDSTVDIGFMLLTTKIFDSLNTFIDIDKILGIGKYNIDL